MPRQQLRELNLHDGDRVNLVFRHVRLFPAEGFREEDLLAGKPVSSAAALKNLIKSRQSGMTRGADAPNQPR